jgi:hypothetical protein
MKNHLQRFRIPPRAAFLIIGVLSTVWFLVRVIPKPSRATYPCMRATAPFMSSFVIYLLGLAATVFAAKRAKKYAAGARYLAATVFVVIAAATAIFSFTRDDVPVYANSQLLLPPNFPVGEAKGIFPGRVVWIWDNEATNENCTNVFGDGWFLPQNTNLDVVASMAADAVNRVAGKETVDESWDALFRYFNLSHGKGDVGYSAGERIFIKINQVSASGNTITDDYTVKNTNRYGMAETSPQLVLAILRQLVNEYGIPEENIAVGDPMKHLYKHVFDMWHNEFPNVAYIDYRGANGRTKPESYSQPSVYYSDRGKVLTNSALSDYLPAKMVEADYMINIGALKGHARAGFTLCAKNHFGSNDRGSASHLHRGLVAPDKVPTRPGYRLYRVLVDLTAHEKLGGNTVLFIVDGLWGGSEANDPPRKFQMAPFNGDWTSSIFMSQDQIALESVCFDFLKTEFTASNPFGSYPQYDGADDYLVQAADSSYWPDDIEYDPENDGTAIASQGVHEHWNDAANKQYSRNLGTGDGIDLVFMDMVTSVAEEKGGVARTFILHPNYPNPFNGSTTISYQLQSPGFVKLEIYNSIGQMVRTLISDEQTAGDYRVTWNGRSDDGSDLASGLYYCSLTAGAQRTVNKMLYLK